VPKRLFAAGVLLAILVRGLGAPPSAPALERSYIPLPEILTDPNEGNTYGALAVVLFLDEQKVIKYILAPDVRYNQITGVFPAFRLFGFPALDRKWSIVVRKSQRINENYEFIYQDNSFWQDRLRLSAVLGYERDATERFFGFGNGSSENDESNYTAQEGGGVVRINYRLQPTLEVTYQSRVRVFRVQEGGVDDFPFIGDEHPDTPGLGGATVVGQEIGLVYDSRDDQNIPRQGGFGLLSAEFITRLLGSSFSAVRYAAEFRKFVPLRERIVFAMHGRINYLQSNDDVPFFEQSDVGGRRSLRGFGSGRFVDKNSFFASAELRTRVYSRQIFGVNAELELAPFLDFGQVFRSSRDSPFNDLHAVGGLGFRGVVRPQVVGFVDIGLGEQGAAVFTGLEYPF
jgi:outer membrane protein assembly factor BamA